MAQLDADESVKSWTRSADRVPYIDAGGIERTYVPDFLVEYNDGKTVVEEIKPESRVDEEKNKLKADAARKYFSDKGIEYKIITENEIGRDAIDSFTPEGFAGMSDEDRAARTRRMKAQAAAARARKKAEELGIEWPPKRGTDDAIKAQAVELYGSGMTLLEVGDKVGASASSVRRWLSDLGVERRDAVVRQKNGIPTESMLSADKYAETVAKFKAKQESGIALSDIEVDRQSNGTGRIKTYKQKADEALNEIDDKMRLGKQLLECLNA